MDPTEPVETVERVDPSDESTLLDVDPDDQPTRICPSPPPPELVARESAVAGTPAGAGKKRRRIGKYELLDKLGRGAFGVVFTARDPSLDRDVAIKVLRPTHLGNPTIVQRFLQEARATARIAHPGIVTIHDCGQVETSIGATAFIAMELLSGQSLTSRLLRCGRLSPAAAIEIIRQAASALEAAHRVDVLHRDLKPDNLHLIPDPAVLYGERVKVLDFGLAKLGHDGNTQLKTVFGTPHYMSPEQCRSTAQVDHRSDIYSLGCILFELITGQLPFHGEVRQLLEHHQHTIAPRARSFAPDVPPALDDLLAEMLAKDPMERPQTMGAVQRALQRASEVVLSSDAAAACAPSEPLALPPPRAGSEPRGFATPRAGSEPRGFPLPEPPLVRPPRRAGSEPHEHSLPRAGSEPRGFSPPPEPPPMSPPRLGSEPRSFPPHVQRPQGFSPQVPPLQGFSPQVQPLQGFSPQVQPLQGFPPQVPPHGFPLPPHDPRSVTRVEAGSGELLMPPSGPRDVLTGEVPTTAFPRQNLTRLVALGVLVVVLSALIAWITAG